MVGIACWLFVVESQEKDWLCWTMVGNTQVRILALKWSRIPSSEKWRQWHLFQRTLWSPNRTEEVETCKCSDVWAIITYIDYNNKQDTILVLQVLDYKWHRSECFSQSQDLTRGVKDAISVTPYPRDGVSLTFRCSRSQAEVKSSKLSNSYGYVIFHSGY